MLWLDNVITTRCQLATMPGPRLGIGLWGVAGRGQICNAIRSSPIQSNPTQASSLLHQPPRAGMMLPAPWSPHVQPTTTRSLTNNGLFVTTIHQSWATIMATTQHLARQPDAAHVDPLGGRPLLALCGWAATMKRRRIRCVVGVEAKEHQRIAFHLVTARCSGHQLASTQP